MKWISLFLVVSLMMIGLSSCGSNSSEDSTQSSNISSTGSGSDSSSGSNNENTGITQNPEESKYVANGHPTTTEYGISEELGTPPSIPSK